MRIIFHEDNSLWEPHLKKPAKDEISLWRFSISDNSLPDMLYPFLSAEEKKRASAYKQDTTRLHYLIGHGALRRILSVFLSCPADALSFSKGEHGKPYLLDSRAYFNLSHSGEYVILALSLSSPVGIDIQNYRHIRSIDSLVSRFFHPQEAEKFSLLPEEEKPDYFFSRWALREAFLKGLGTGLAFSPASFLLKPDPVHLDLFSVEASPCSCHDSKALQIKNCQKDFPFWQLKLLPSPMQYSTAISYRLHPLKKSDCI